MLVLNSAIGIVQEVRAKRSLDRLALLNAPQARVRRDGEETEVASQELVADDVILLAAGDQILVDGEVLTSVGLEVDESLLTGEADPVDKAAGTEVMSGSFVAAGSGSIRATAVGTEAYAFKLASEARRFSLVRSELRTGIDKVIKMVSWLMVPTAILLVSAQLASNESLVQAVQGSVAGLVAMVPEGLVLLTSIAFAVGATRLATRKVLTQELAAIEGLARVDVICLDKTGTLTEGALSLATVEHLDRAGAGLPDTAVVLAALGAADDHPNPSLAAIVAAYDRPPDWRLTGSVPFSSARKWSGAAFEEHGAWVLGAPDILLDQAADGHRLGSARERLDHYAARGRRVLMLRRGAERPRRRGPPRRPGAGRAGRARRAAARVGARDHRVLRGPGCGGQGDLGRQPGHGRRRRPAGRRPWRRRPGRRPRPCPTTPTPSPRCSTPTPSTGGSPPSRSGPWCTPCSRGATPSP